MQYRQFFGQAAIYTISNFVIAGIPFFLLPALTRFLNPAEYGIIGMFTMLVSFISVGVGLNVHGAITVRYFDRSGFDIRTYVTTTLIILAVSTGLMLAFIAIAGSKLAGITAVSQQWLYVAVLVAFLQFLVQIRLVLWQDQKKPMKYAFLRFSHAVVDAVCSIVLVFALTLSWQGRLSGILAGWLCVAIIAVYFLIKENWLSRSVDVACAKDALNYGFPLVPHVIGALLLGVGDRFIVNKALGTSSVGVYVVAIQIGLVIGILADSVNKAFVPWLMEGLVKANKSSQKKIVILTYVYFIVILALAALAVLVAPYILPFIVGPQFQSVGPLLKFILFGYAFTGMYYFVTNYIFYSKRTGLLSILTVCIGLLTLILSWFLINTHGLKGAAIGFMIGQASLFLGAWLLSNFCIPMPWFEVFQPRKVSK